jgi:hypothetical protein
VYAPAFAATEDDSTMKLARQVRHMQRTSAAAAAFALAWSVLLASPQVRAGGDPCAAGSPAVITVTNSGASGYFINGVLNGPLTVVRGCAYTFNVTAPGHPFLLKTVQGNGLGNLVDAGVTGQGAEIGTITWTVDPATPQNTLFYNCQFHPAMTGTITVISPPPQILFADGFEDPVR